MEKISPTKILWSIILSSVAEVVLLIVAAYIALVVSGNIKLIGLQLANFWLITFVAIAAKIIAEKMRER